MRNDNLSFIAVAKPIIPLLKSANSPNLIDYQTWEKSLKMTQEIFEAMISKVAKNSIMTFFVNLLGIKNKLLTEMIDYYKLIDYKKEIPKLFFDKFGKEKKYLEFLEKDKELEKLLKTLPLLTEITTERNSKIIQNELVWYINKKGEENV